MLRVIKRNLGVCFMILVCLDFTLISACAKILSEELSSIETMFFRNVIGITFMLYILRKLRIHKEGGKLWLLIFGGVVGTLSLYLLSYNVSNITLGGAFVFQKTSPIFITLITFVIFKENIGLKGWFGIFIVFLGVLFIAQLFTDGALHSGFDLRNSLLGVSSGFLAALVLTSVRELRSYYATEQIAFSFILISTLMPLISMFVGEFYTNEKLDFIIAPFVMPPFKVWIFILAMGILGTIYQMHITKSYGVAKQAEVVAGVSYLDVVFFIIIGVILGDALPSAMVFLGIVGIAVGGLILVRNKKKQSTFKNL